MNSLRSTLPASSSLIQSKVSIAKKSGQSDRSDRSGDRKTLPQNHQIALSILPTEKEKLNEFETLSSPRPLLHGGASSAYEQYQFSEEKQILEPQTEP